MALSNRSSLDSAKGLNQAFEGTGNAVLKVLGQAYLPRSKDFRTGILVLRGLGAATATALKRIGTGLAPFSKV